MNLPQQHSPPASGMSGSMLFVSDQWQYWFAVRWFQDKLCYDTFSTHEQLETFGCVLHTVGTDVLVLKHQAISTHSAD